MTVQEKIVLSAGMNGVDPNLALAIADRESGFDQNARGAAGEIGVFQLMPGTASDLGVDPYSLDGNIAGGVRYLAQQFAHFGGDPFKAVAAYNAGPRRVSDAIEDFGDRWFDHVPASTQDYVATVVGTQQGTIVSAGGPGAPLTAARIEPLAMAAALAAGLLVLYSYAASEPNGPDWEDLFL